MALQFPALTKLPLGRYAKLLGHDAMQHIMLRIDELRVRLSGRVVWNVSSTAAGGGVAEMVRSLLAYARGADVDARWVVIEGSPAFFHVTKRLHNAIHGSAGDGSPLGPSERAMYEQVAARNAVELLPMVRPHDIVIVHDPQPAGLVPALAASGAHVIWRCHIGHDAVNAEVERAWQFLAPYVRPAHAYVFSRASYVPFGFLDSDRAAVIPPTIDPFSAKNQPLDERSARAILAHVGLIQRSAGEDSQLATFVREDGTPGRVDRIADVVRVGVPPDATTPLVVQVSRWDRLKDPCGVLLGFARLRLDYLRPADARPHLVLAGPSVTGVTDDPEGAEVLAEVIAAWRELPLAVRERVHLASIPTTDIDENAAIVNALQRHATVIVQKSLHEGFGLTVAEGMWKAKPIIATAVGGIQDQIDDGVQGILLADPSDLDAFADALAHLLADPDDARRMGQRGHTRVLERYLGLESLLRYGALIESVDDALRDDVATQPIALSQPDA